MSQETKSLRVRRTQKLLREALIELIEEQSFDALTVSALTERAMVSRAAFYRNYQDKYDLVEQIFGEAMQALSEAVSETRTDQTPETWVRFFEHIAEYERLYGALLGRKGSSWFVLKMRESLVNLAKEYERLHLWQPPVDQPVSSVPDEFVIDLVSTMFVEAITWWLEQGRPYAPQEIANRCTLLVSAIFKETSSWQ